MIRSVSAKDFIDQTTKDLNNLGGKVHYYQNSFAKVGKLFGQTNSAFYEITSIRNYFDSVQDTAQDIKDINNLIHQIDQLQAKRKLTTPPPELNSLAQDLDQYYAAIHSGMDKLLVHEQTQQKLLELSGDKYNLLLDKIGKTTDTKEFVNLTLEINPLIQDISQKMESYPLPEAEKDIFAGVITQHRLKAEMFARLTQLFQSGDPNMQTKYNQILKENNTKTQAMLNNRAAQNYVSSSPAALDFQRALELETKLYTYFHNLNNLKLSPTFSPTRKPASPTNTPAAPQPTKGSSPNSHNNSGSAPGKNKK
jgi:hypothetical protein